MFIIWGTRSGNKKLDFAQAVICNHCGRRGLIEVFKYYTAFTLFFIPTFRWGTHYVARMSCCGISVELDRELGKQIERGQVTHLDETIFPAGQRMKRCPYCGHEFSGDFNFCPNCGERANGQ